MAKGSARSRAGAALLFLALVPLTGCAGGGLVIGLAMLTGMGLAGWMLRAGDRRLALAQDAHMRLALASGQSRELEMQLRRELALVAAGEAVSPDRAWLSRVYLASLLAAEWRLEEAEGVLDAADGRLSVLMKALADRSRLELRVLAGSPDEALIDTIQASRESAMKAAPRRAAHTMREAWDALEGLARARRGEHDRAAGMLQDAVDAGVLERYPSRVIYLFHLAQAYDALGDPERARRYYSEASGAFPGTRLASDAQARARALGPAGDGGFRRMLPEAPVVEAFGQGRDPETPEPTDS